jgi:type VI secretion system secreted protein VgrG
MPITQQSRTLSVNTVLGPDVLLLRNMAGTERLSAPFEYDLTLLSENVDIAAKELLGTPVTVALALRDDGEERRFFNGYVSRFAQVGFDGSFALYRGTVVPWLWFLSRRSNCRIFQEKTVLEIVKTIFRDDHGFTDFEERLSGTYRKWDYCVQYRETDLNFVSRLLEHEGIYYFHEHTDGKHTLVLADGYSAHAPVDGYERIPYYPPDATALRESEHVNDWSVANEVRPGAFAHTAFDFTAPRKDLQVRSTNPKGHPLSGLELFDYPDDYREKGAGEEYARVRLQETQVDHEVATGAANARGLACGALFTLSGHFREDQNREHLVTAVHCSLQSDLFASGGELPDDEVFRCRFEVVDAQAPYRPTRRTPKPFVQGPQTAIVVGKSGEEIWTDKYGRVKVQFHWDRYSKADETSSCWVRVAQVWAGKGWGGLSIPRIGQEVIVDFLEGDPDQPIVTGRVYNGECMPPYPLPGDQTRSTLKSCSSKGGGGFNEIRLEDKKGSEQIFVHAEKNHDQRVKNDAFEWIGHERHLIVGGDQLEQVGGDKHLTVAGDQNEAVDGTVSLDAGTDLQQRVGMNAALDAGMEIHLKGGMNVVIEAGVSITLKAGGGFVVVGPAGVTISGIPVLINSGGSAGAGSGCSPDAPKAPKEADKAEPGQISDAAPRSPPAMAPAPKVNVQAMALTEAAKNGTPFCEKCEAARRVREAQAAATH